MDETKVRQRTRREDDVQTGRDVETEASDLKRKEYESKLRDLHVKLVELQEWVRREGKKICIIFEDRERVCR